MKSWLLFACVLVGACAHNPRLEAFDRALELLVVRAAAAPTSAPAHRDCVDTPSNTVDDSYDPGSLVVLIDVTPAPDREPDERVVTQRILEGVFCGTDIHDEIKWKLDMAIETCHSAWLASDPGDNFGPEASTNMLDAKVAYETFLAECGSLEDQMAFMQSDFYGQLSWRPYIWNEEWDGCFGTHPSRASLDGVVLEYY